MINDCGKIVGEGKEATGWFDLSNLKEPYRIEGKKTMGWIGNKRPRMVAVQASGCAPIVKAFEDGAKHAEFWPNAHTSAAGIRVSAAIGDFLILRAVRQSGGFAIAVDDNAIEQARNAVTKQEGLLLCPEGAATFAAWKQSVDDGWVLAQEQCVLYNCATGLKYPMPETNGVVDRTKPIDYASL